MAVKYFPRGPLLILVLVLLWRVLLLVFTVQPIPASDAFGYDGGVVNFLHGDGYRNPCLAIVFPIAGREIYATYPPLYQGALLVWMKVFGTSAVAAMGLHLALFGISGLLTVFIIRRFFPAGARYALAAWLLFGLTFNDRPESLAYVFGLTALWLVARQIADPGFRPVASVGLLVSLLCCLYASVIVGAYFFGIGFLACAAASWWRRLRLHWLVPFLGAAGLFAVITLAIAKLEPRWWAGFMESAGQQSVMTSGLHGPHAGEVAKLVRTTPIFLLGLLLVPWFLGRQKAIWASAAAWPALVTGIFVMGWGLLVVSLTLLPANYFGYAIFTQVLLAAGLLALVREHAPQREAWLRAGLWACVALVSVRAVGMTSWGAACAWKNSYQNTQTVLREELEPYVHSDQPVLVSSPFLYGATAIGVKNPIHSDWYFDHAHWTNNAQTTALERLHPPKLVLSQFDYYRNFEELLAQFQTHPELVAVRVRNLAVLRAPDSIPSLQRVIQHISWAPVVVDLDWKQPPP